MWLESVCLGLSVRSWIAMALLVAALLVVVGYVRQMVAGGGHVFVWVGFVVACLCLIVGALPTSRGNRKTS